MNEGWTGWSTLKSERIRANEECFTIMKGERNKGESNKGEWRVNHPYEGWTLGKK